MIINRNAVYNMIMHHIIIHIFGCTLQRAEYIRSVNELG